MEPSTSTVGAQETHEESKLAFDMMANCAHDLKTPLAAISTSNQLASSILNDIQRELERINPTPSGVLSDLEIAKSSILTSLSMTEFMKMSINRCMDFAKVRNYTMKLSPKCETVDIMEALQLPLKCMATIDSDRSIEMLPLPEDLCSHVITDLQWLQENVLCLTSNAAKYSSSGTTSLRVTLCPQSSLLAVKPAEQHGVGTQCTSDVEECLEFSSKGTTEREPISEQPQDIKDILSSTTVPLSPLLLPRSLKHDQAAEALKGKDSESVDRMMVLIECEDSGIGLSEEAMANLFTPFKQAQRLAGGTGLGLFSLANRMESLQGLCGVRGRRDGAQGSLFWFAFPYKPDEEAALSAREQEQDQELTAQRLDELCLPQSDAHALGFCGYLEAEVGVGDEFMLTTSNSFGSSATEKPGWQEQQEGNRQTSSKSNTGGTLGGSGKLPPSPRYLVPEAATARERGKGRDQTLPHVSSFSSSSSAAHCSYSPSISPRSNCESLVVDDSSPHILLVDDTASIRKITSRTLQREGFRVTTAENGYEALKLLQNQTDRFDAVLMDLQMPVLDGLETVRRFRAAEVAQEGKRRQFIVAVSASADPTMAKSVMEVGFDGYMEKPFSIKMLRNILPKDFGIVVSSGEGLPTEEQEIVWKEEVK